MAGLLAAEGGAGFEHLFEHVLVAHLRAQHADAAALECGFESHVRHSGGDHGVVVQQHVRLHVAGRHEQHAVTVHNLARGVGEHGAVGIAVEGDAEIVFAVGAGNFGGDVLGMERAAVGVDVASVGIDVQEVGVDVAVAKNHRRDGAGGSVGAVDKDAQLAEAAGADQ